MTVTEFLEARIAEDEAAARRVAEVFPGDWDVEDRGHHAHVVCDGPNFFYVSELEQRQAPGVWLGGALEHIARWDPARVLAECAAKRAVIGLHAAFSRSSEPGASAAWSALGGALQDLAAVYSDHPDYDKDWAL